MDAAVAIIGQASPVGGLAPTDVLAFVLLDLTIILGMARLLGALFLKIRQPRVVGEIVAGVLLGPTLLGAKVLAWDDSFSYFQCDESLSAPGTPPIAAETVTWCVFPQQARGVLGLLGQLALVLFMFLVGLELDYSILKGKAKGIALVAFGAVAVPVGLAFAISPVLYGPKWAGSVGGELASESGFTLFVAAMLAVTAFPVMARILQEKRLTQSAMGSIGIASAALVSVLMFLLVLVASGVASDTETSDLFTKFLLTGLYIGVLFMIVRPALVPMGRRYERSGFNSESFALILLLLLASSYVAHKIGINVIVGGFLAGAVLPARKLLFRDLSARLGDLTATFLLPIFLAFSGLNTDFTTLGASFIGGIGILLGAAVLGKWLGSALFARVGGLSWAEGNVIGILMNCRGLLVLVVGLIGAQQGIISAQMQVAGVVVALVTTAMTGPLFDRFAGKVPASDTPAASLQPANEEIAIRPVPSL